MSKPVYEIPDDGESYPPATSRRAARAAERPTVSPDFGQVPPASYLNAPPPTTKAFPAPSPTAEANYANSGYPEIKFDPNAYGAPATAAFDLGSPSFDAPVAAPDSSPGSGPAAFDPAAFPPPSSFDPAAFPPPAAFDPGAYAPPAAFEPAAFEPTAFAPPAFDPSAFPPPGASAPTAAFDPAAFAPPTFDPAAFGAPVAAPAFEPEAFDPSAFPPPAAAPAFSDPSTPSAPSVPSAPEPWESAPVATPRAAFAFPATSDPDASDDFSSLADDLPQIFEPPAMFANAETQILEVPPVEQPFDVVIPSVEEFEAMPEPQPVLDLGFRSGAHAAPSAYGAAAQAEEVAPALGLGEEGSDVDLVTALNAVVALKASDLHITAKSTPMIRVDGSLEPAPNTTVWNEEKLATVLHSIMSESQREKFEAELELDFAYRLSEDSRFRVNVYQQRGAMGAAFRLIPTKIKQLGELGVPDSIGRFAGLPRGLVLVTGPTGSGKSTTLAALIDLVNRTRADHVVTVEDPIEFMHENKKSLVNQREVGGDTHSFTSALKHVLRQDPDVILIGELRDLETISVALTAAETGHLVFATLHTQSAAQTIDRVIDVFPPHQQGQIRAQLAATLQGVVCQTLVKHASGTGRVVATEVMITTPAISNLIREGKTYQITSALQAGKELGMFTLDQHLAELVDQGKISHNAAMEKAHDLEGLTQMIHRADPGAGRGVPMATGIDFGDQFSSTNLR